MRRLLSILLLLTTACYDSAGEPGGGSEVPVPTTTLAELQRLFTGETFEITADIVVSGYVTSDDRAGNFYRTLVVEDGSAAAEIMAGIDGLHNIYPTGQQLAIRLEGLAVGQNRGVLQIGLPPETGSGYATDYIGSRARLDRHLFRSGRCTGIRPVVVEVQSLTPGMAGRFVRIDGVRFAPEEAEPDEWAGTKRFATAGGDTIRTYTRPYAAFAGNAIPASDLLLAGILQCDQAADGTTRYTLRLRDEKDCWY